MIRFVRVRTDGGRACVGRLDGELVHLLDHDDPLAALRGEGTAGDVRPLASVQLLPPVDAPEIWCAGVTYERSRDARVEEAQTDAERLFMLRLWGVYAEVPNCQQRVAKAFEGKPLTAALREDLEYTQSQIDWWLRQRAKQR